MKLPKGNLDFVKNVISLNINYEEFAKLLRRSKNEKNRTAQLQSEIIIEEFNRYGLISQRKGYSVLGVRTRFVNKKDAIGLAKALGYSEKDVVEIK